MARLRWGANSPDDTNDAREILIDAAESCIQRFGLPKTKIEDIAAAAEVSRATVYRYFADRDELILGVILRATKRHFEDIRPRMDKAPTFADGVADFVALTVRCARDDQNLGLVFAPEVAGASSSIAGRSTALFALVDEFLRPYFEATQTIGLIRPGVDLPTAAEMILRMILSLLSTNGPGPQRSEAQTRELALIYLVPALMILDEQTDGPA